MPATATFEVTSELTETLGDLLEQRTVNYRMFSRLFLKPLTKEEIEGLTERRLELVAADLDEDDLLSEGFNDMGRGLHRQHSGTQKLLSTDFTMCFDGISSLDDVVAVPYASVFIGAKTGDKAEYYQEPYKADKLAYAREGIEVDSTLNLPADHLSFELSFMADLSSKAGEALAAGDAEEVLRLLEVSQDFCNNHILSWYGKFFDLAIQIIDTRFYRGVLKATYGYLRFDVDVLEDAKKSLSDESDVGLN